MEEVSKVVASDVQASFRELAKTASQLNFVSDALGKYIAEIESGLKTLNLGVASWVTIEKLESDDGLVTIYRQLGYDKVGKNWCVALQTYKDAVWSDDYIDNEIWAFGDAPRSLRVKAIDQLAALLRKLNSDAAKVAKQVAEKLPQACDTANKISAIVDEKKNQPEGKAR